MPNYAREMEKSVKSTTTIYIYAAVILVLLGLGKLIPIISEWAISAIFSAILTGLSQIILHRFTGDTFEKILIIIEYKGFKFSFTLFAVLTIILKLILFKQL